MELKIEIKKQNKKTIGIWDLLEELEKLEEVCKFDSSHVLENIHAGAFSIHGNFNPSDIYQKICSNGYSILNSEIAR